MGETKTLKVNGFYRNRDHGGERVQVLEYNESEVYYRNTDTKAEFVQDVTLFHERFYAERYTGYCDERVPDFPIKPGQVVTIPRGTVVRSMHPTRKKWVVKRAQKVTVHHVLCGITDTLCRYPGGGTPDNPVPIKNPTVRWPGSGGYWCEVDVNEVLEAMEPS